jgi:hypothetical protein
LAANDKSIDEPDDSLDSRPGPAGAAAARRSRGRQEGLGLCFAGRYTINNESPRRFHRGILPKVKMPFKEKAIVRHKLRPEWGAGRVLVRTDEYLQIDFSAGGLKKLKTSIADEHLEAATAEQAKALKPENAKPSGKRVVTPKVRMV